MKTIILVLVAVGMLRLSAQEMVSHDEWNKEYQESWRLAGLLYPDVVKKGTQLNDLYWKSLPDSTLYPRLAHDSFLPLFQAAWCALYLKITPSWTALSDSEKNEAFQQNAYVSTLLVRVIGSQNQTIASYHAQRTYVSPVTSSFIPEAIPNLNQATPAVVIAPPMSGATEDSYFLPPTQIAIEPQTGTVIVAP